MRFAWNDETLHRPTKRWSIREARSARDSIVLNLDMKAGCCSIFRCWMTVRLVQRRGGDETEPQSVVSGLAEAVTLLGNSTCSSGHESCLERAH